MKYFSITSILYFLYSFSFGQNLVLNPQFEEYYHLPDLKYEYGERYEDSVFICKHWYRVRGTTPDYYHVNAKNDRYEIPYNMLGYCPPVSLDDSAYMGFIPLKMDGYVEPFSGEFTKSLEAKKEYQISFVYRYAGEPCYFYLNKIEVFISKDIKQFKKFYIMPMYKDIITSEIKANVTFTESIINDGKWHKITGYYTAKGGEQYISFGIFYQNEKFNKIINEYVNGNFIIGWNPNKEQQFYKKYKKYLFIHKNLNYKPIKTVQQRLSYYFIDDVCVEIDTTGIDY
ncbi:MAG: hypothetical protein DRJ01_16310 [Bacteroidetes bacterium]|nr:MAG: hypothetical protein DRJ01_16310 [Bacteroidota bacterium]